MTETEITPQSVAADKEPKTAKMWRILRRVESGGSMPMWKEQGPLPSTYGDLPPEPQEIGPAYGEGEYLIVEGGSEYTFHATYVVRVVAEKRWRAAEDGESA